MCTAVWMHTKGRYALMYGNSGWSKFGNRWMIGEINASILGPMGVDKQWLGVF